MGGDHAAHSSGPSEAGSTSLWETFRQLSGMSSMDPSGLAFIKTIKTNPCKDCTVLRGSTRVVYANGTKASVQTGVYIHHSITVDATKEVPEYISTCNNPFTTLSYFLGADVGRADIFYMIPNSTLESGYYLKDNTLVFQGEFVNYRAEPQEVFVELDVEYMPGRWGRDVAQRALPATS
jgi:hypothetical protein